MVVSKGGIKGLSENVKAQLSRAELRDTVAKKFIQASYAYSKWYTNRLFLEQSMKNNTKGNISLTENSMLYVHFVERAVDVWVLIKYHLNSVNWKERHEFDLKLIELMDQNTTTQRVADIFNTLNHWVSKVCPLEEIAYWQGTWKE